MTERMTDAEVLAETGSLSPLDRARQVFESWASRIEATKQYLSATDLRRAEFEAVQDIINAWNQVDYSTMKFLLSRCDVDTAFNRKVRSLATGTEGLVTHVDYSPPYFECYKHGQRHTPTITIDWVNGNKSVQPLCDLDGVEIIK